MTDSVCQHDWIGIELDGLTYPQRGFLCRKCKISGHIEDWSDIAELGASTWDMVD